MVAASTGAFAVSVPRRLLWLELRLWPRIESDVSLPILEEEFVS
jgi:hypothetical protein